MQNIEVLDKEYVTVVLGLFISLYALSLTRINLPQYIINLFENTFFRIAFLSLLLILRFEEMPHVAFTIALIFVLTLENINRIGIKENLELLNEINK